MFNLTTDLKHFIEDNIDLIESNTWDDVYNNAVLDLDSDSLGELTAILLDLNIDPLVQGNMEYIPQYYLSGQNITSFIIPDTIHALFEGCFCYSRLHEIIIPPSVTELHDYVFYDCYDLDEVTILGDIVSIGAMVFYGCSLHLIIKCKQGSRIDNYAKAANIKTEYIE